MHPTVVAGPSREANRTGSRLRERDQIHKVPCGTSRPAMSGRNFLPECADPKLSGNAWGTRAGCDTRTYAQREVFSRGVWSPWNPVRGNGCPSTHPATVYDPRRRSPHVGMGWGIMIQGAMVPVSMVAVRTWRCCTARIWGQIPRPPSWGQVTR